MGIALPLIDLKMIKRVELELHGQIFAQFFQQIFHQNFPQNII